MTVLRTTLFFLLLLLSAFLAVRAEGEEAQVEEVEDEEEGDPTIPFTCFVTVPKPCQTRKFELAEFLMLPDNNFPGLIFKVDTKSVAEDGPKANFFNSRKEFLSTKSMNGVTHKNLLSFFEENDFPLVHLETFKYTIHSEFDFGGHHYQVALMRVPYFIATELAEMREYEMNGKMEHGYLAQIGSQEEQDAIFEELSLPFSKLMGFGVWLGGHKDMDKVWHWENGEMDGQEFYDFETQHSSLYTNWAPDRPFKNDKNTQRCLIVNKRGEWLDENCFMTTKSVVFEFGTEPQVFEKKEVEEELDDQVDDIVEKSEL